jgi:hypothetical protein
MAPTVSSLSQDFATALAGAPPPCVSLYQRTHRRHPDNQQDPIRFRNLVKEVTESLRQAYPTADVARLLAPVQALAEDAGFWNHALDGLAVFAAPDRVRVLRLPRPVSDFAIAADSFHVKPLRRLLQTTGRYQVLGLSRDAIRMYEGDRDALDEIELAPDVPRTLTGALGTELTEPRLTVTSYGGAGPGTTPMRHGHGGRSDEVDLDTERFFRAVDRAVTEHHSRVSGLPLILAALAEHHPVFRQVSHNPRLVAEGITINPAAVPLDELRRRAWQVFEPAHHARLEALGEDFRQALAGRRAGERLAAVAEAAAAGRVRTLLVEADRRLPGRLDADTGRIEPGAASDPAIDDLLDDLAELVEKRGGEVWVLPPGRMPTDTGVAAVYRYADTDPAIPAGGASK